MLAAALLLLGSIGLSETTLSIGMSAEFGDECALKLLDLSSTRAMAELSGPSKNTAMLGINESVQFCKTKITLAGISGANATFVFSEADATKKIIGAQDAIDAAAAFVSDMPNASVKAERADCDGARAAGACWAVSGYETKEFAAQNVTVSGENVTLPGYSRFTGKTVYVDADGNALRIVEVT
ncbi:Uncharacterised protein [Candidatus Norongarragalina meridionalis]|nr:Uncharacterised protein [Candidatus Norongarragalina meridionalis]